MAGQESYVHPWTNPCDWGGATVTGNFSKATGPRGRGPSHQSKKWGRGQGKSMDLLSSYYVLTTVLNTLLFFLKITEEQGPIASFHNKA